MSQLVQYEVECRKCGNIVKLDDEPNDNWRCLVCDPSTAKSSIRHLNRCASHPHFVWSGMGGPCSKCTIDKMQKRLRRGDQEHAVINAKHKTEIEDNQMDITRSLDNMRRKKLEEEQKANQSVIEIPGLIKALIQEIKQLREELTK